MNSPSPNSEDSVAALFGLLLEGEDTGAELAANEQLPDPTAAAPTPEPTATDAEIGLLQEILVSPGLRQLQERCSALEKGADRSEERLQALEMQVRDLPAALARILEPLLGELLDRKLEALEERLLAKLNEDIEQHIERQIEARVGQPQNLSIRVVGIQREDN